MNNLPFNRTGRFAWQYNGLSLILLLMSNLVLAGTSWQEKVSPLLLRQAEQPVLEFIVHLSAQADLSRHPARANRTARISWAVGRLQQIAAETQPAVTEWLHQGGVEFRSYWIVNRIWVRGQFELIESLARREDISYIYANPRVPIEVTPQSGEDDGAASRAIEWNIVKINAPDVWAKGITGQGVTIAGQDTGYDWDHPALISAYRGWDGMTADHNYHWHDAIHSGGGGCGADSLEPCDDHGHGTHTMGTMVGDDGGSNQIGVAPGARWIGCRNMDQGVGTPTTYTECFQWFLAPTDLDGNTPDSAKAPHVVNNSWGCPTSEGCVDPEVLRPVVENLESAGILVVVSAGNSGSSCSTVSTPAAIYAASYTVGNTTSSDAISTSSSRGPVTVDASGRMKPNISAPGSGIRSSTPGSGYGTSSGTSMAAPHVAGLSALLIAAAPHLEGNPQQIRSLINSTAVQLTTGQECGGVPGSQVPNNTFGYGRIDALAAFNAAGGEIFGDGFE